MATTSVTREQQLEQRIEQLENTVTQLIRSTSAAVTQFARGNLGTYNGGGTALEIWHRTGAEYQDITGLHGHLQRHPAPSQD